MQVFNFDGRVPVKAWVDGVEFEAEAQKQAADLTKLPFIFHHVAIMPDCHAGKGSTVGSVIVTHKAIVPAAVGVDLGCGMVAQMTTLKASDLPDDLRSLRNRIEDAIPHGRTDNGGANDRGAWGEPSEEITRRFAYELAGEWATLKEKTPAIAHPGVIRQLGTLGTGNHFVELCLDTDQNVWLMLHSGSRGVGNGIGNYYIDKARKQMERYFIDIPSVDLGYLPESEQLFEDYWKAITWAQKYAFLNRQIMMDAALRELALEIEKPITEFIGEQAVNCHHNFARREHHFGKNVIVTRKGAVSAREGEMGIIPGSMGAKSFIVRGKGNPDSFHSCSHGAGRRMSRTKAKATISVADHIEATKGVECLKDERVLDESPAAYKSIEAVIAAQSDLIEIVAELKQVLCVKG